MANGDETKTTFEKIGSAGFYAAASFIIVCINKIVLTTYKFPSFQILGLGQMIATLVILYVARKLKYVSFPAVTFQSSMKVWPLPLFYLGNLFLGLGGTQSLSLPMFVVLRRFSILFTMIGQHFILKIPTSTNVQISVYMMIGGAIIAASDDVTYEPRGYFYVLINNVCTAGNGIMMKRMLDAKELGKQGLLFFNALLMLPPSLLIAAATNQLSLGWNYDGWLNPPFLISFLSSCCMGFVLNLSIILCTHYNSPLTTTIIGCLKNIFSTYFGMYIGGDYIFSWSNFIGLNISVIGSLIYSYLTFRQEGNEQKHAKKHTTAAVPPTQPSSLDKDASMSPTSITVNVSPTPITPHLSST